MNNRAKLLSEIDRTRRDADHTRMMESMDSFNQRAIDLVTGSKMSEALKPSPNRARPANCTASTAAVQVAITIAFLLSRRLIEAGVRVVSFSWVVGIHIATISIRCVANCLSLISG